MVGPHKCASHEIKWTERPAVLRSPLFIRPFIYLYKEILS